MWSKVKKYLLVSLALLIIHLWYFNLPYILSSELTLLNSLTIVEDYLEEGEHGSADDFLFINTAYDNTLVPYTDTLGFSGNIPITDRDMLDRLFQGLDEINDPQEFIVCDIDLSIPFHGDTSLFKSLIGKKDYVFPSSALPMNKKGVFFESEPRFHPSRYSSFDGSIAKIELWNDEDVLSMPYHLYSRISAGSKEASQSFSWLGFFPRNIFLKYYLEEEALYASNRILTLSEAVNILSLPINGIAETQFKDKVVFIGNLSQDRHITLKGDMAGLVIIANCYLSLVDELHIIPWKWIAFAYLAILLLLYVGVRFEEVKAIKFKYSWFSRLIHFISYSFLVTLISILSMGYFSVYFSVVPMVLFYLLYSIWCRFKNAFQ